MVKVKNDKKLTEQEKYVRRKNVESNFFVNKLAEHLNYMKIEGKGRLGNYRPLYVYCGLLSYNGFIAFYSVIM